MRLSLFQMQLIATGALVLCFVAMVICRLLEQEIPWLTWPRSFFEAATVGALADWFAVVALFRHPMGLPIPHTAILPKNKKRVGEALATFVEESFLSEERLGPYFRSFDYAGLASDWLKAHAREIAGRATGFLPGILEGVSDEEMKALLVGRTRDLLTKVDLGPALAGGLELLAQGRRDREVFLAALKAAKTLIAEHRRTIEAKISEEIPISSVMFRRLGPLGDFAGPMIDELRSGIARMVAEKTIQRIQAALDEAGTDQDSEIWKSFQGRLTQLIESLKSSPEMSARIQNVQKAVAESGLVDDFAGRTWGDLKEFLLRDCEDPNSLVRTKLEDAIHSAAAQVGRTPESPFGINRFVGEQVVQGILASRPRIREFIESTIASWNAEEMAARLETTVGRDLQFIRLNGTFVGGLVGLAIHTAFFLIGKS